MGTLRSEAACSANLFPPEGTNSSLELASSMKKANSPCLHKQAVKAHCVMPVGKIYVAKKHDDRSSSVQRFIDVGQGYRSRMNILLSMSILLHPGE